LAAVKSLFGFCQRTQYIVSNPAAELVLPSYENRLSERIVGETEGGTRGGTRDSILKYPFEEMGDTRDSLNGENGTGESVPALGRVESPIEETGTSPAIESFPRFRILKGVFYPHERMTR
jgi:hypothetical protein